MENDLVSKLTPEQKDKALRLAVKVCMWTGRTINYGTHHDLEVLKQYLEESSGMEIEEHT